jgi:hypothetical protein
VNDGDSLNRSLTFQADAENVLSRVTITIMDRAAVAAFPAPHSKRAHTFRTAGGNGPAARARLGSVSLVSLDIHRLPSGSLVPQHVPERGPARIQNGFRHSGFSEPSRVHIADDDQRVFPRHLRAGDVEMMFPRVGDLRRYRACALLVSGALCLAEGAFVLAIVTERRDCLPVAARRQGLQPKIDTDLAIPGRKIVGDLTLKGDIPSSASVLNEGAGLESAFDLSRLPEIEPALEVDGGVTVDLHCARDERYPAERTLCPEAGAKARASAVKVSRCGKLAADGLNGIGMQSEIGGASGAEFDQVEGGRPADAHATLAPPLGLALRGNTEVPDLIAGDGVASEVLASDGILDAVSKCENAHFGSVLLLSGPIKSASLDCRPVARSRFVSLQIPNINQRTRFLPGLNAGVSAREPR